MPERRSRVPFVVRASRPTNPDIQNVQAETPAPQNRCGSGCRIRRQTISGERHNDLETLHLSVSGGQRSACVATVPQRLQLFPGDFSFCLSAADLFHEQDRDRRSGADRRELESHLLLLACFQPTRVERVLSVLDVTSGCSTPAGSTNICMLRFGCLGSRRSCLAPPATAAGRRPTRLSSISNRATRRLCFPDAPRGPTYVLKDGVLHMSLKSGVPIAPVRFLGVEVHGVEGVGPEDGFRIRSLIFVRSSTNRSR